MRCFLYCNGGGGGGDDFFIFILKAYYDILERELINRKDNDSIEDRICNKVTKACEGVDFEALRQEKLKK